MGFPEVSVVLALAGALTVALAWRPVLRHLPEPPDDDLEGWPKPTYASLATWPRAAGGSLATLALGGALAALVPREVALWLPLVTAVLLAGAIDLWTTFLPRPVMAWAALAVAAGVVVQALLPPADASVAGRGALGALAGLALGWLAWRFLRFGWGDARLLALTGAATAAASWRAWYLGLLAGVLIGAVAGLIAAARARQLKGTQFAYGPWLVLGALAGLATPLI